MTLKLKTNRNNLIALWIPLFIILVVLFVAFLVDVYYFDNKSIGYELTLKIGSVAILVYLLVILLWKFWGRRLHIFTSETITVLERKKQVYLINVEDIARIKYIKFDAKYIWRRISGDAMLDGDACKMYIGLKDGSLITLGCFSMRDVLKIDKLYKGIVEVI